MAWKPLDKKVCSRITEIFHEIYPEDEYPGLASGISTYWLEMLKTVWDEKPDEIKTMDLGFSHSNPLERIMQKTVIIAYPDSIQEPDTPTLASLQRFMRLFFPEAGGLHVLPACRVAKDRFNDGYFSQVCRNEIDPMFGNNKLFARIMRENFSMTDFVVNHVDIEHSCFRAYIDGDNKKKDCFYIFSEDEYLERKAAGDFDEIFRPRPFPLFTIFRREPSNPVFRKLSPKERIIAAARKTNIDYPLAGILSIFKKIKNDQMLLDEDYAHIVRFRDYLDETGRADKDKIFILSSTQETRNPPYIFNKTINKMEDLLFAVGFDKACGTKTAHDFNLIDKEIFGETFFALTTFSHVQVDLNTQTYEGLKLLADDFSWYLGLDLNMLRLDAANFAFKKWKTSCFGLPEVRKLMQILFLSMEAVSPRMVANLEVNDTFESVLNQMADKNAPPPMMYDFHLPCLMPVVFITKKTDPLFAAAGKIKKFDIPKNSIRFSVVETHDGKSVRGSLDLLSPASRLALALVVRQNGGQIKYKAVPAGRIDKDEFNIICKEFKIDLKTAVKRLFAPARNESAYYVLNETIRSVDDIADALDLEDRSGINGEMLLYLSGKLIEGKEPYELCTSTRNALPPLADHRLEARRFISLYTLAFAMMGRNVKSIYFNDLLGLPNDLERMKKSGELRDIKRTRSSFSRIKRLLSDHNSFEYMVAKGIHRLILLADNDPAFSPYGEEAMPVESGTPSVAMVLNRCRSASTAVLVNTSENKVHIKLSEKIPRHFAGWKEAKRIYENFEDKYIEQGINGEFVIELPPFGHAWITVKPVINLHD